MSSNYLTADNGVSSGVTGITQSAGNDGTLQIRTTTSGGTATTAVTVDNAQNVGVGVTPSAWASTYKSIDISGGGSFYGTSVTAAQVWNAYNNGTNWIYKSTNSSALYLVGAGTHTWYNAAGGTAGNAITFTQAMTLDASGNLGLGVTPSTWTSAAGKSLQINNAGNSLWANGIGGLTMSVNAYYNSGWFYQNNGLAARYDCGNANGTHTWGLAGSGTANGALSWYTAMTLDASGNLLVGQTYPNSTTAGIGLYNQGSAATAVWWNFIGGAASSTEKGFSLYSTTAANYRFYVNYNGGVANYQANNVNLSDLREKTNFAPAKSYLDVICAIPVQTFNFIDQAENDPGLTLGVVAQDVQEVAPELVAESNWGTEEEPKMRLSIYQTDLQYALMKCIQELNAKVTALQAKG